MTELETVRRNGTLSTPRAELMIEFAMAPPRAPATSRAARRVAEHLDAVGHRLAGVALGVGKLLYAVTVLVIFGAGLWAVFRIALPWLWGKVS